MRWIKIAAGHYRTEDGGFSVQRHDVDDREVDGGYALTQWFLYEGETPFEILPTLGDAKRTAERIAERRAS